MLRIIHADEIDEARFPFCIVDSWDCRPRVVLSLRFHDSATRIAFSERGFTSFRSISFGSLWLPSVTSGASDAVQSFHVGRSDVLSKRRLCCSDPVSFPIGSVTPGFVAIPLGDHANVHDHARIKVQSFGAMPMKIKPRSTFAFEFKQFRVQMELWFHEYGLH